MDITQKSGDEVIEDMVDEFVTDLKTKGFGKISYVIQGKKIYKGD